MTSAQTMRSRKQRPTGRIASGLLLAMTASLVLLPACSTRPGSGKLGSPTALRVPSGSPTLWAVAPLANETGTTAVNRVLLTDLLTEQVQQVQGLNTVPVNRVLLAMQQMQLRTIATPQQASQLMKILGVDGLVVGTITTWDPYQPPKLGLAVQLYTSMDEPRQRTFDLQSTRTASSESPPPPTTSAPMAQAAGIWDAANHHTLAALKRYAQGRTRLDTAYGHDIYLVDMDLYTQFVAYQLVAELLRDEQNRLVTATKP